MMFKIVFHDDDLAFSDGTFRDMYNNEQQAKTAARLWNRIQAGREIKCGQDDKVEWMTFAALNPAYVLSVVTLESA